VANNYLQFSEQIDELTDAEVGWIQEHLEIVSIDADEDSQEWKDLAELYELDRGDYVDFQWDIEGSGGSRSLWIYAEESGNPEQVGKFVQAFLKKWRPNDSFVMTWAAYCSKLRIGEFQGGAIFVTKDECHCISAWEWAERKAREWNKAKEKHAS
jgi:hypothetical protein